MPRNTKSLAKQDQVVLDIILQRLKAHPYKNVKQMDAMLEYLNSQFGLIKAAKKAEWDAKKAMARTSKNVRVAAQSIVCGRWAQAQLRREDVIGLRSTKGRFRVIDLTTEGILCQQVVESPKEAPADQLVSYEKVEKIYHEGKWLDVYSLASGG